MILNDTMKKNATESDNNTHFWITKAKIWAIFYFLIQTEEGANVTVSLILP